MTESPKIGYLGQAVEALRNTRKPGDAMGAAVIEAIITKRGGDIFIYKPATKALQELEMSEDLSRKLNAFLSCFNRSPKAATFLAIEDPSTSVKLLKMWFKDTYISKEPPNFIGNHINLYLKTLQQFGMVKREGDTVCMTKFGREYGQPIAAKMIDYEKNNAESLYLTFGQTSSPEDSRRAPLTRAKILLGLMEKSTHDVDFLKIHPDSRRIAESLIELQRAGMVNIDYHRSVQQGKTAQYKILNPADYVKLGQTSRKMMSFAKMVADACVALEKDEKRITMQSVFRMIPEEYRKTHSKQNIETNIHHLLKAFATETGFLENTSEHQAKEIIKKAVLTDKGEKLVRELLLPMLDAMKSENIMLEWRKKLVPHIQEALQEIAQDTFKMYAPYSPGTIKENRQELKSKIMVCIENYSIDNGGDYDLRAEDIARLAGLNHGSINTFLSEMVDEKMLKRELKRGYFVYRIA